MADHDTYRDQHTRDEDNDRFRPDDTPRVAALSDLHDFKVADGYPDPRGWRVLAENGTEVGKVHDLIVDTGSMRTRYLDVRLDHDQVASGAQHHDDDWDVLVPVGSAQLADKDDEVMLPSLTAQQLAMIPAFDHGDISREYESSVLAGVGGAAAAATGRDFYETEQFDDRRFYGARTTGDRTDKSRDTKTKTDNKDTTRIAIAEEELDISKREVRAGEAVVHKHVETEHVSRPVTLRREEVTIERRPVEGRDASNATFSDDENEIRIPLMSEEAVVEKRPVVKEEIVITKHAVTENKNVEADLRRERVDVDQEKNRDADQTRNS